MKYSLKLLLISITILSFVIVINADETGWSSPENFYYVYNEFNSPEEAMAQDDTYSQSDLDSRADEQDWYECDLSDITALTGCPVIDGIIVEFDAYAGGSGQSYQIKLTWDSGSSWTSPKTSSTLATFDSDTYIAVGGATDTWGRTWSKSEFIPDEFGVYFHHNAGNQPNYLDHIRVKVYYTYTQPNMPSGMFTNIDTNPVCNNVDFYFTKGTGADYTLVKWLIDGYPTFSTGTQIYNGTGNSFETSFNSWCEDYYVCAWSWNSTYCRYSQDYDFIFMSPCNWNISTIYNNTENITGTIETQYNCETGWKVWVNMTGNETECDNTSLTLNTNMTNVWHSNSTSYNSTTGWEVNVTAFSQVNIINNTVNCSITIENVWNNTFARWDEYINGTCDCAEGDDCTLKYLNYSDNNITVNITYWGCNDTNTTTGIVNEDNWLLIQGFSFESGELGIFLTFIFFSFAFIVGKKDEDKVWRPILLFIATPIALATGVFYLGNSMFNIEWWIGIAMLSFAVLLGLGGLYYGLNFGRR